MNNLEDLNKYFQTVSKTFSDEVPQILCQLRSFFAENWKTSNWGKVNSATFGGLRQKLQKITPLLFTALTSALYFNKHFTTSGLPSRDATSKSFPCNK